MYPKPYQEKDGVRTFSKDADSSDFIWHTDLEDREITVIAGDWLFQFDNELPFKLNPGDKVLIAKGRWHRVIKGNQDLIIKINRI